MLIREHIVFLIAALLLTVVKPQAPCPLGVCYNQYLPMAGQASAAPTPTPIPAIVAVLPQVTAWTDSIGYLHLTGEVANQTIANVQFVKIVANFYDSSGRLIDTDFTYPWLDRLAPGATTCFDLSLKEPDGWASYRFEPPTYSVGGEVPPDLVVQNDTGRFADSQYEIVGEVRNPGSRRVEYVQIVDTLYRDDHSVLGCGFTYVSSTNLDPGQTSSFKVSSYGSRYSAVGSYRLQVDGTPK